MAIIYSNYEEAFNSKPFILSDVPESYSVTCEYFLEHGPIKEPNEYETSRGTFFIRDMVDMFSNNISFSFYDIKDIKKILTILDGYLEIVIPKINSGELPESDRKYIENCIALGKKLAKLEKKRLQTYYYYYPNQKPTKKDNYSNIIKRFIK